MGKEKKEIWMEKEIGLNIKLHNLFKEYIENYGGDAKSADSLDYVVIDDWQAFLYWQRTYLYETLISKKFGMVKWLVENDKINLVKVYENLTNYEIEIRIRAVKELLENNEEDTIAYLKLLMLLAIQDEPIRFLCEIFK